MRRTVLILGRTAIIFVLTFGAVSYGFPVLYGDQYSVTVQFEGEAPQEIHPPSHWGIGDTYLGGDFTGSEFEPFWPYGSQDGYVTWRTFSSQLETGLEALHVGNTHASIRAQASHINATYVDFTVSGLDGWKEYPSLSPLEDFQPDIFSIVTAVAEFANINVDETTLSFRVMLNSPDVSEFNIGFRGISIPEPITIVLLGLGGLILRKQRA